MCPNRKKHTWTHYSSSQSISPSPFRWTLHVLKVDGETVNLIATVQQRKIEPFAEGPFGSGWRKEVQNNGEAFNCKRWPMSETAL